MKPFAASPPLESIKNPLISQEQIEQLRRSLDDKARDLLLFDLATQTGMRLKDLLRLKVGDIQGLAVGKEIPATRELRYLEKPVILTSDASAGTGQSDRRSEIARSDNPAAVQSLAGRSSRFARTIKED